MYRKIRFAIYLWLLQQSNSIANDRARRVADLAQTAYVYSGGCVENVTGDLSRAKIGNHTHIRGRVIVLPTGKFQIGEWSYIGHRSEIWSQASVQIGNRVLISHDVNIHDTTAHSLNAQQRHQHHRHIIEKGQPTDPMILAGIECAPIVIEDDVWIGFGATILKGVRIGAESVISAGSMVTKDVPPRTVYRCQIIPVLTPLS